MIKFFSQKSKETTEKEIYNMYAEKMLILCIRYLNNLMDAEEVLHNGLIKVFNHLHKFEERHEKAFEYWIRKIMINECLMFLRKRVNFNLVSIDEINEKDFRNVGFEGIEDSEDFWILINSLPLGYKTIFNLYVIEEYQHNEISEMLGISESTSRSQLTKARKLLQQKILKKKDNLYA